LSAYLPGYRATCVLSPWWLIFEFVGIGAGGKETESAGKGTLKFNVTVKRSVTWCCPSATHVPLERDQFVQYDQVFLSLSMTSDESEVPLVMPQTPQLHQHGLDVGVSPNLLGFRSNEK
jgi:hypothetical protein